MRAGARNSRRPGPLGREKPCRAASENALETAPQICPRNPRQMAHSTAPAVRLRHCFTDEILLCALLREQGVGSSKSPRSDQLSSTFWNIGGRFGGRIDAVEPLGCISPSLLRLTSPTEHPSSYKSARSGLAPLGSRRAWFTAKSVDTMHYLGSLTAPAGLCRKMRCGLVTDGLRERTHHTSSSDRFFQDLRSVNPTAHFESEAGDHNKWYVVIV